MVEGLVPEILSPHPKTGINRISPLEFYWEMREEVPIMFPGYLPTPGNITKTLPQKSRNIKW